MVRKGWRWAFGGGVAVLCAGALAAAAAQSVRVETSVDFGRATHVVLPQARGWALRPGQAEVGVERVAARVEILGRTARTELQIEVANPGSSLAEAVLLLPVPAHSAVSGFDFEGAGSESSARLLPADEARRTYDGIVAKLRDPALLEFAGHDLVRSSVFPVPAQGRQRVRLVYEHVLEGAPGRIDYVLPRSESLARRAPWSIAADVRGERALSTVYSPTHKVQAKRLAPERFAVRVQAESELQPGPFQLAIVQEEGPVSASLYAYPDAADGGGYVLLVAGLPARAAEREKRVTREVTVVIDRSGSMAEGKLDQARAAARGVIGALAQDEWFRIVDYSADVSAFAPQALQASKENLRAAGEYLDGMRPLGGTNLHDALVEALRPTPTPGTLPIVLFLTDGRPTVGRTAESDITASAEAANPHGRRVFTFGVGADVNVPLLDRLSDRTRASSTFVAPNEDVEVAVAAVFQRLYGPVFENLRLTRAVQAGSEPVRVLRDMVPAQLPDLFEGDSLVVLARYTGEGPLHLTLGGRLLGEPHELDLRFTLEGASVRNAFVPRLWAARQIAYLVDEVRQAGADPALAGADPSAHPRLRELRDEILRLSTRFGILTEHTAFLALEGSHLDDWNSLLATCGDSLRDKAIGTRWGTEAVGQGRNFNSQKMQVALNNTNEQWSADLQRVEFAGAQQVADRTFFARGGRWIDARLVSAAQGLEPDEVIEFGSPAHGELLRALQTDNRQGCIALAGDVLIEHSGKKLLVRNSAVGGAAPQAGAPAQQQEGQQREQSGGAQVEQVRQQGAAGSGTAPGAPATGSPLSDLPANDVPGSNVPLSAASAPVSASLNAATPAAGGPTLRAAQMVPLPPSSARLASDATGNASPPPVNAPMGTALSASAEARAPGQADIDLAICLDTSGSMDGLIDSARQKIWELVSDLALLEPQPRLRVALLTFGNDGHSQVEGWVHVQTDLTHDLDLVSARLFALTTNGGTEYVGRVVGRAASALAWSQDPRALRLIVVAGNESADQDPLGFREACKLAIERGIVVNSIYCGAPEDELAPAWREVARLAEGHFASIDQNAATLSIATPFDEQLAALSTQLNQTYIPMGNGGAAAAANQVEQDLLASRANQATAAERANCKAGGLYWCSWDLVDAMQQEGFDLDKVARADLPEALRTLTPEALREHVAQAGRLRAELGAKIQALYANRQEFVVAERARLAREGVQGLDDALRAAIRDQAAVHGFRRRAGSAAPTGSPAGAAGASMAVAPALPGDC